MKKRTKFTTTKLSARGLRLLRIVAAARGERQYRALENLLERERVKMGLPEPEAPEPMK
ncbi:MAG: hypothetical protein M0Z43_13560 [Acidithiobacillus sp.]|nr:hypothetical protein [Acidithiobacillus sp.]